MSGLAVEAVVMSGLAVEAVAVEVGSCLDSQRRR